MSQNYSQMETGSCRFFTDFIIAVKRLWSLPVSDIDLAEIKTERLQHHDNSQSSKRKPSTRENSWVLCVTKIKSCTLAMAAICKS